MARSRKRYRAGTLTVPCHPGLYATFLKRANEYSAKAQAVADPQQAAVIGAHSILTNQQVR
jgi:hypothetical protein